MTTYVSIVQFIEMGYKVSYIAYVGESFSIAESKARSLHCNDFSNYEYEAYILIQEWSNGEFKDEMNIII